MLSATCGYVAEEVKCMPEPHGLARRRALWDSFCCGRQHDPHVAARQARSPAVAIVLALGLGRAQWLAQDDWTPPTTQAY